MGESIISDNYYSAEEAADYLKVKEQTVKNYLRNGELKGVKRGPRKKWFILGKELEKKMKEFGYL